MIDTLTQWFNDGTQAGAKWLLIVWDAYDLNYEPQYSFAADRPVQTKAWTWHVEHILDLAKPLDTQRVYINSMPW